MLIIMFALSGVPWELVNLTYSLLFKSPHWTVVSSAVIMEVSLLFTITLTVVVVGLYLLFPLYVIVAVYSPSGKSAVSMLA